MGTVDFGKELVMLVQKLNPIERGIMVAPNIEVDTQGIAPDVESKELVFVCNASAFHPEERPKVGIACSVTRFYYCNRAKEKKSFLLDQVENVSYEGQNRFGSYSPGDKITITLHNGETHVLGECMLGLDGLEMAKLLTTAATDASPVEDPSMTRCLSLGELPLDQQVNYMAVLYNYAFISDCKVDSSQYAALQSIVVRMGMDVEARNKLRDYFYLMQQNSRTKTGVLIKRCRDAMSYGSYEIFRYSLMQDALYLRAVSDSDGHWYEDPFINGLQQKLEVSDEQVETMLTAIELYKEMQRREADLIGLKNKLENLWHHAKAIRIPREAIFCSGSVYNVDTYRGLNRQRKLGRSITLQRELMLQAVIRNTQESINHLVEDMNDVTIRLLDEVQRGNRRDEQIQLLSQQVRQFQRQARAMVNESAEVNVTRLYNRLPARIATERIEQLIPQQRELVEQCYVLLPQGEYQIKEGLRLKDLTMLVRIKGIVDDG